MFEILKPFFFLLTKKKFVVPRWIIWKALAQLAYLKRIHRTKSPVTIKFGKFNLIAPDYHILSVLLKEKFVYNEYYFSSSTNSPVIVDGGSNIGISVLYFKHLYPNAIIHCFEPYSRAYAYLEMNIRNNYLDHVHLNKLALSDARGATKLFVPSADNIINGTITSKNGDNSESVESIKLSDYIAQYPNVDLIKLDVEGSEVAIVKDLHESGRLGRNAIKHLIIEFHASVMEDADASQKFIALLTSQSYNVTAKMLHTRNAKSDFMISAHQDEA